MTEPKRVTVEVDDDLHHRAKVKAVAQGRTLSDIVRDALRAFVGDKPARKPKGGAMGDSKK